MTRIRTRLAVALLAAALHIQVQAAPSALRPGDDDSGWTRWVPKRIVKVVRFVTRGVMTFEETPAPPKP